MRAWTALFAVGALLALPGCKRGGNGSGDAAASASATATSAPAAPAPSGAASVNVEADLPVPHASPRLAPPGEAFRTRVANVEADAQLRPHVELVRKHFGAAARGPFAVQRVELAAARLATLLTVDDDQKPLALITEGDTLVWAKERPDAGILPPSHRYAITARAGGGAAFFFYDVPTEVVAGRLWLDDGSPFADFELLHVDRSDALSAAYWPGRGHIVVTARNGSARLQILRENGALAWPEGIDVSVGWRAAAPVTIVIDTRTTFALLQHATGRGNADAVAVQRYDAHGRALWPGPTRVEAPRVKDTFARINASRAGEGVVRIETPRIEIDQDGHVRVPSR